ncbi:N-acetylmuramoyl-L-alanine amidase [Halalkalibacter wakoensis]|nr:N-acetylmuramoyl-L-alanine amidase [Halalkalibacter wakoensis]
MKKPYTMLLTFLLLCMSMMPVYASANQLNVNEVKEGDTLPSIAQSYEATIDDLQQTNGLNMQGQHILMTREEFKNWLFNNEFTREISLIQQHHTWLPAYAQFKGNNHFQMLESMENFHKSEMGWNNIAQNITTFPDGKIAVSRPFNSAPEGTIGPKANANGLTIENIGNFDIGNDTMTAEQKETIVYLTALLCIKFGLTPSVDSITYHHWWHLKTKERVLDNAQDYDVKTCPGTGFFGGNSTESAKKYFYPLVSQKIEQLLAEMK